MKLWPAKFHAKKIIFLKASYGASIGWLSAVLTLLKGQNSPLSSGPISIEGFFLIFPPNQINDQLWLIKFQSLPTSVRRAALAVSSPRASTDGWELSNTSNFITLTGFYWFSFNGQIAEKIGRKKALISLAVPQMLSWIAVYFAATPMWLVVSRLLHGFAGGGKRHTPSSQFIIPIGSKVRDVSHPTTPFLAPYIHAFFHLIQFTLWMENACTWKLRLLSSDDTWR